MYRSATPGNLSRTAPDLVKPAGVSAVLDLREQDEIDQFPDILPTYISYLNVPIYRGPAPIHAPLGQAYLSILTEQYAQVAAALRTIARFGSEGLLIHCTAGKDRTGLVVGVALAASGLDRRTILDDYRLSEKQLPDSYRAQIASQLALDYDTASEEFQTALDFYTTSPQEALGEVLDHIDYRHGSMPEFVVALGVTEVELEQLRQAVLGTIVAA